MHILVKGLVLLSFEPLFRIIILFGPILSRFHPVAESAVAAAVHLGFGHLDVMLCAQALVLVLSGLVLQDILLNQFSLLEPFLHFLFMLQHFLKWSSIPQCFISFGIVVSIEVNGSGVCICIRGLACETTCLLLELIAQITIAQI